jgi:hypothetical protein
MVSNGQRIGHHPLDDTSCRNLGTMSSDKGLSLYFLARFHGRKTRDFDQIKCIKNKMNHALVKDNEIRHRRREYFDKLFNGENEDTTFQLDDSFHDMNRRFLHMIQEYKVREALKIMKG